MSRRTRSDDDFDYIYPTFLGIGQAHGVAPPDDESPEPAGVVWVPDPEQRRGWRERYITKEGEPKPGARPMGFRKP